MLVAACTNHKANHVEKCDNNDRLEKRTFIVLCASQAGAANADGNYPPESFVAILWTRIQKA